MFDGNSARKLASQTSQSRKYCLHFHVEPQVCFIIYTFQNRNVDGSQGIEDTRLTKRRRGVADKTVVTFLSFMPASGCLQGVEICYGQAKREETVKVEIDEKRPSKVTHATSLNKPEIIVDVASSWSGADKESDSDDYSRQQRKSAQRTREIRKPIILDKKDMKELDEHLLESVAVLKTKEKKPKIQNRLENTTSKQSNSEDLRALKASQTVKTTQPLLMSNTRVEMPDF